MISTWKELNSFIEHNKNKSSLELINELLNQLDYDSTELRRYQIKTTGSKYNASVDFSIANNIIDFNKAFNNVVNTFFSSKKNPICLNISFKIEQGSSNTISDDLFEILNNNIAKIFDKMDSKDIKHIAMVGIICFSIFQVADAFLDYYNKKNFFLANQETTKQALDIIQENTKLYKGLINTARIGKEYRQKVIDNTQIDVTDSITINGEYLDKETIKNLQTKTNPMQEENYVIEETFKILKLDIPDSNKVKLTVIRSNSPKDKPFVLTGSAQDNKGALTNEEIGFICDAIKTNNKVIKLKIKVTLQNSKPIKGEILSFVQ